jgi:hypothetical protein
LNGVAVTENAGAGGCSSCGSNGAEVGGAGLVVIERLQAGTTTVLSTETFTFTGSTQTWTVATPNTTPLEYVQGAWNDGVCPQGTRLIATAEECKSAVLTIAGFSWGSTGSWTTDLPGCELESSGKLGYFNTNAGTPRQHARYAPLCVKGGE